MQSTCLSPPLSCGLGGCTSGKSGTGGTPLDGGSGADAAGLRGAALAGRAPAGGLRALEPAALLLGAGCGLVAVGLMGRGGSGAAAGPSAKVRERRLSELCTCMQVSELDPAHNFYAAALHGSAMVCRAALQLLQCPCCEKSISAKLVMHACALVPCHRADLSLVAQAACLYSIPSHTCQW